MNLAIKKDDNVIVISGDDKGKIGKVLKVDRTGLKLTIQGVNVVKKHIKANQKNPQGGIVSLEKPLHYCKVMLVDSKGKPTRVSRKRVEKGGKTTISRIAKTTGEAI